MQNAQQYTTHIRGKAEPERSEASIGSRAAAIALTTHTAQPPAAIVTA